MKTAPHRRRRALGLLATSLFLLVAVSFHTSADNDLGRMGAESRAEVVSASSGPDSCAACALDSLLSVCPSLSASIAVRGVADRLVTVIPPSPFVAPRASVDSRPPPAIA